MLRLAFPSCLRNRHQMQLSRSRFFYRKTTLSCLKARFNTENCRNDNILLKDRNKVQRKLKEPYNHRRKVMYETEFPKEAILHCQIARRQTSPLAILLLLRFSASPLKEHYSSFHFAGSSAGSQTSKGSFHLALPQWVLLCYYV